MTGKMQTKDQIRRRIVELTHIRMMIALGLEGRASVELDKLDAEINALYWVLGGEQFNAENYGA